MQAISFQIWVLKWCFFQFKYHSKIYSPRGLVQCENVQIMHACALYIFLPDGTAQIYSVLHKHFRRGWTNLVNFKMSFVNVKGFFLQCLMMVSSLILPQHWSRPQKPELKEKSILSLLPVGRQTACDCWRTSLAIDFAVSVRQDFSPIKLQLTWDYALVEGMLFVDYCKKAWWAAFDDCFPSP